MKRRFQAVKGTRDILPPESALWNRVEQTARQVFAAYNFQEIRLPLFEETELFARSVGAGTDIVSKELYEFEDRLPEDIETVRESLLRTKPAGKSLKDHKRFATALQEFANAMHNALETGRIPKSPPNESAVVRLRQLTEEARNLIAEASKSRKRPVYWTRWNSLVFSVHTECLMEMELATMLALRPEATASVVRAYIEHGMHTQPGLQKLYYIGPMFRRERPQKGRFRQFYQIGAEVLGPSDAPSIDAEIIELVLVFIEKCGLQGCALYVNSIGCSQCRAKYVELLRRELTAVKDRLGPDSQRRLETNPLRVLDSKVEDEQPIIEELPSILDHLCSACREHFQKVQQELKDRGLTYQINRRLVRGLDYYTRTTFEITAPGLGAQNAICGGGRYDGLAELLGGPPTKGTGWALGTDRLLLALEQAAGAKPDLRLDVFVIWLGEKAYARARQLARRLRDAGVSVELVYEETKLKKALGWADRAGARYALILGEDELAQNQFTLREMQTGSQQVLTESQLLEVLVPRRRETVLILEEEEAVRKLAREAFQQGGYTVIEVKRKADLPDVTQQGKFKPDLVLLDVSMPAFAAQDVIDQLKQIGPDVGIIMLTGPGMTQAAIERLKQGLRTEVVEKPFTPGALTHVASRLLQTRRG